MRRWWFGLREWIMDGGGQVSVAALPLRGGGGLRRGVRHLRRVCRDLRDRAARSTGGHRWRGVAFAGMAVEDGTALVMIAHAGITRADLARRLGRRFGRVVLSDLGDGMPALAFSASASAEIARLGRGAEPLRVVVAPQHDRTATVAGAASSGAEPMPSVVAW
jgi:hypothetical protein